MQTSNNTILITGGSAGIGLATAKKFAPGNNIIIVGRNRERLQKAAAQLREVTALPGGVALKAGNVATIAGDVSDAKDLERIVEVLYREHPSLNIVVNNAGTAHAYDLATENIDAFDKASEEMLTNYLSIVRLNEKLLPLLRKQPQAAIVNVSSIVAITPGGRLPTYSPTKAALHSYTLSLRHALAQSTAIKVFELMPPLVDTALSAGIGGHNGIAPSVVADELAAAIANDQFEIHVGDTAKIYQLYLSSPQQAFAAMNNVAVNN